MPFSPGQLLMMRRRGPAMGPPPGLAAPALGGAATPGALGGTGAGAANLGQLLGQALSEMSGRANDAETSYVTQVITNMKRMAAVMVARLDQSHPGIQRHLVRALTSLDAALKESKQAADKQQNLAGPSLGFSGAQMNQGPESMGGMRVNG